MTATVTYFPARSNMQDAHFSKPNTGAKAQVSRLFGVGSEMEALVFCLY